MKIFAPGRTGLISPVVMTQFAMTQFAMTQFAMTQFAMTQFAMTQFAMTQFAITPLVANAPQSSLGNSMSGLFAQDAIRPSTTSLTASVDAAVSMGIAVIGLRVGSVSDLPPTFKSHRFPKALPTPA